MLSKPWLRVLAGGLVALALILLPSPILPPHRLAELVQSVLSVRWKIAYLVAALGLQATIYVTLGLLIAYALTPAKTARARVVEIMFVPLIVVGAALMIRSLIAGYFPVWVNVAVPIVSCLFGVWLGFGLLARRWWLVMLPLVLTAGGAWWILNGSASAELSKSTEEHLRRLMIAAPRLPEGDARFTAALQEAFSHRPDAKTGAIQQNRAAILALGLAIGHERLGRFIDLDQHRELVHAAFTALKGTTLRGREDWPRHFCLSAALAALENPLVSDASGLMKEQLDVLTRGSGFSFGDLAADRAGVRFAEAATYSEESARAFQMRLGKGVAVDDLFPPVADLPENLTVEQFRRDFGGVGSERYRQAVRELEVRLDSCVLLSPLGTSR